MKHEVARYFNTQKIDLWQKVSAQVCQRGLRRLTWAKTFLKMHLSPFSHSIYISCNVKLFFRNLFFWSLRPLIRLCLAVNKLYRSSYDRMYCSDLISYVNVLNELIKKCKPVHLCTVLIPVWASLHVLSSLILICNVKE